LLLLVGVGGLLCSLLYSHWSRKPREPVLVRVQARVQAVRTSDDPRLGAYLEIQLRPSGVWKEVQVERERLYLLEPYRFPAEQILELQVDRRGDQVTYWLYRIERLP
jgi:hypothetical protein